MMMMRKMLIGALALIGGMLMSGCATNATHVELKDCAKGKRCVDYVAQPMEGRGGGIHKVTLLTQTNREGQQVTAPMVTSSHPDRLDTMGPAAIMGGMQVWATDIHADAIKSSGKNRGPSQVFIMAPEGGSAQALNNTEVGVSTSNETTLGVGLQPVHFCDTCNGNK